ncbi:MAG TPA: amidohydrolase family protein [Gammaproteobacteria bacterium]
MTRTTRPLAALAAGTLLLAAGGFAELAHAQGNTIVLTGARLIDGTGAAPIEQAALVLRDGRIVAAGPAATTSRPDDAVHIALSGKTIIPGLINAHGHLNEGRADLTVREQLTSQLKVAADYGVTTVVVLGSGPNDLEETVRLRDEQDNGRLDRARVYVAGPSLRDFRTEAEARAAVDAYADARVDVVKIHITGGPNDMTPAVYGALIDQAHSRGLRVAAHLYYLEDAHGLVDAGVDVIAHSVRDRDVDAELIAELNRRGIAYTPTLTRDLAQYVYESTPAFFNDPFFLRHEETFRQEITLLSDPAHQERVRNDAGAQAMKPALEQGMRNLKTLSDAGVLIALGTDSGTNQGQWLGYFEHTELEMMVEAGMTPAQVLYAATGGAARSMELDDELGTLQPGRRADLVVLNANPLEDIRATREIDSVWIGGVRLDGVP